MKLSDFKIGETFICGKDEFGCENKWKCTDIGSRVITAIRMDDITRKEDWTNGPPYAILEHVFDEYDQPGCEIK